MRGAALIRILARTRASRTGVTDVRFASTAMRMPAMSPTMTEGGIAGWKKNEGESFAAGDVLLEVETDKATIDVEAQDDGVLGKILVEAGSSKIPVGQVIAVLAEEGDDLASLEIPKNLSPPGASASSPQSSSSSSESAPSKKEDSPPKSDSKASSSSSSASPAPSHGHKEIKHSKPIFPSVLRLLTESDLSSEQISKLKGTGKHGMLTKGDVLVAIGKLSNPYGSAEKMSTDILGPSGKRLSEDAALMLQKGSGKATSPAQAPETPLTPAQLRRLIVQGMAHAAAPKRPLIQHVQTPLPRSADADFDAILAPYASLLPPPQPEVNIPGKDALAAMESKGSMRKSDDWAGLF